MTSIAANAFRGSFGATLAQWKAAYRDHQARRAAYRQTVWELSRLDDRELADIDISRADIHRLARENAGL
jgi:uncharacterized protein YjiS (DUF1127 family)